MNQYPSQESPQNPYPQYPAQQPAPNPYPQPQQAYPMQINQRPKPRRRGCLISAIVAIVVVIVIVVVVTTANGKTNNTGTSSKTTNSGQTFKVGDVVTVGTDWQVTVNSVKTSAGGDFDQLKTGDTFLEISVTMKNISSQEQDASSLIFWSLKDSTGQQYDEAVVTDAPSTPDGKVAAGDKLTGTLSYQVPLTQKQFELSFAPDPISSGQTIWKLQR